MKITFQGYAPAERSVTVDEEDLALLSDIMRSQFLEFVEYSNFASAYQGETQKKALELCAKFGVESNYTPDRLAFFRALLGVTRD